jgi:hypothetical protein
MTLIVFKAHITMASSFFSFFLSFISFLFHSTGASTQGLHLEPLHQSYFCEGFVKIGSCELFAGSGFELRSS